jgi:hypothetical protein
MDQYLLAVELAERRVAFAAVVIQEGASGGVGHKAFTPRPRDGGMVEVVAIALVAGGAVLLFTGAALSVYGVALLGAVIGGSGGYLVAPTIGGLLGFEGLVAVLAAIGVGVLVGVAVTYALLSFAIAAVSFVVGTFLGLVAIAPVLVDGPGFLVYPVAVGIGIGAAILGMFATKTAMVLVTAGAGATLVSRSITLADLEAAQAELALEPLLFDVTTPLFLGLFVLGLLSQFGLFKLGYVTKLVGMLPGASAFTDSRDADSR